MLAEQKAFLKLKLSESDGRKHVLAILVVLLCSGVGCKDNPVVPPVSNELWPLKPGNEWLYFSPYLGRVDTFKIEVTGTLTFTTKGETYQAGRLTYSLNSQERPDFEWLAGQGSDGVYKFGGVSSTDTLALRKLW